MNLSEESADLIEAAYEKAAAIKLELEDNYTDELAEAYTDARADFRVHVVCAMHYEIAEALADYDRVADELLEIWERAATAAAWFRSNNLQPHELDTGFLERVQLPSSNPHKGALVDGRKARSFTPTIISELTEEGRALWDDRLQFAPLASEPVERSFEYYAKPRKYNAPLGSG